MPNSIQLILPKPHAAQRKILKEAKRYNVVACGRRFGKSTLGVNLLVEYPLVGLPAAWFAPNYKFLLEAWRDTERILKPVIRRINASERRIELITGGVIEFWTLEDDNAGRSRKYKRVIIDEAGLVQNLGETWQAAIRPTLADLEGDAWLLGTPKGRNFFHDCFRRGLDPAQPNWACWQMPTNANPYIKPAEIAEMRRDLTERREAQEVDAEFLDDAGGVFRNVADCATLTPQMPIRDHQYVIGVDWGKSNDYSVFSVIDATTKQQVYLDRSNQVDYAIQEQRLQALYERYKPTAIIPESNSIGVPIIERLERAGMPVQPFYTSNASKAAIIDALSLAFERKEIAIINDPVQVEELRSYEMERLPSGLMRYSAPEGMHDDTVMALAMSWYGAMDSRPGFSFSYEIR